jgi:hypothetical protein
MNLNKYKQNLINHKYYSRTYGGFSGQEALQENLMMQVSSDFQTELLESVNVSGVIDWFHEVKRQIDVMVSEIYSGDEKVISMLNNIQSAFANKHPNEEISPDDLKRDLDHIFHVLSEYRSNVSGSLKQYIGQLADTVKTISLDEIVTASSEPSGDSAESEEDFSSGGGLDLGSGDSLEDSSDLEDEGEDSGDDFDFEKELEDL